MGQEFITVIKQVGIFMICAQAVMHFRPKESYEKYIKLLVSVMVLIQLFIPVAQLLAGKEKVDFEQKVEEYKAAMEAGAQEITISNDTAENRLEQMTLEEVKSRLDKMQEEQQTTEGADTGETAGEKESLEGSKLTTDEAASAAEKQEASASAAAKEQESTEATAADSKEADNGEDGIPKVRIEKVEVQAHD